MAGMPSLRATSSASFTIPSSNTFGAEEDRRWNFCALYLLTVNVHTFCCKPALVGF